MARQHDRFRKSQRWLLFRTSDRRNPEADYRWLCAHVRRDKIARSKRATRVRARRRFRLLRRQGLV